MAIVCDMTEYAEPEKGSWPDPLEIAKRYANDPLTGNRFMRRDDTIRLAREVLRLHKELKGIA